MTYEAVKAEGEDLVIRQSGGFPVLTDAELAQRIDQKIDELLNNLSAQGRRTLQQKIARSGRFVDINNDGLMDWVVGYQDDSGLTFAGSWSNVRPLSS